MVERPPRLRALRAVVIPLSAVGPGLDISPRRRKLWRVDQPARKQIRLIPEDASDHLKRAVEDGINGLYRTHAGQGMLQSGSTLIAAIEGMEEATSKHITACIDRVKAVAMDNEAFAMIHENLEVSLT